MSKELEPYRQQQAIEMTDDQAMAVYQAAEEMMKDLQLALALIKRYQSRLDMLAAPDPDIVEARSLFNRHGETYPQRVQIFRVLCDGVDITEHPDSIEGSVAEAVEVLDSVEVLELEEGEVDRSPDDS